MAERVVVSRAEQKAARWLVKRDAAKGRPANPSLVTIANAAPPAASSHDGAADGDR